MNKPSIAELLTASGHTEFTEPLIARAMYSLYGNIGANLDQRDWSVIMRSSNPLQTSEAMLSLMYNNRDYLVRNTDRLVQSGYVPAQAEITYRQMADRLGYTYSANWSDGTSYDYLGDLTYSQLVSMVPTPPPAPTISVSANDTGLSAALNVSGAVALSVSGPLGNFPAGSTVLSEQTSIKEGFLTLTANGNTSPATSQFVTLGTNGDDTIDARTAGNRTDYVFGSGGNDAIRGGDGSDILLGGDGNDDILGNEGDDLIYGGEGNDIIQAGQGNDTVYGGNGDDVLDGGTTGDDVLDGGTGNDIIVGRQGADVMRGGAGADTFRFFAGDSGAISDSIFDSIADYTAGAGGDRLDVVGVGAIRANGAAIDVASAAVGTGPFVITAGVADGIITLGGADLAQIDTLAEWIAVARLAVTVNGEAAGFAFGGNTYVFQENTGGDLLIQLTGLTGVTALANAAASNTVVLG